MKYKYKVLRSCAEDVVEIMDWYNFRRPGLGDEFLLSYEAAVNYVKSEPLTLEEIYKDFRKITLNRFPYNLIYKLINDEIIFYAVFHHKRSPKLLKNRLQND